jgi:peptidoglycan/xylan/chitin deacetylase (PgdA/CDA1 family)
MAAIRSALARVKRAFKRRFAGGALILVYHRVAEERLDPWRLCVSPANFGSHLKALRALGYEIVHVSDLARELAAGKSPRRTVAVTFDDGYRDNQLSARPLLEKYDVPATLFATAGYIGRDEEFWWDVLERIFLQPGSLPPILELDIDGQPYRRELGETAGLSAADAFRWPEWKPFREPPTIRHQIHDDLWKMLVGKLPEERDRQVSMLLDWAGLGAHAREARRPLSEAELRQLRGDGLVQIGAHSMTHPALPSLPPAIQAIELRKSKSRLEELLGGPVLGFSYPQGRSSEETELQVRSAGYAFACGSVSASVSRRADLYQLPRLSIGDWDETKFTSFVEAHIAA